MSFGLGRGRDLDPGTIGLTAAQLPPIEGSRLGPESFFGDRARAPGVRFEIEIGSGKGTFLVQEAPKRPETLYLGIEYAGEFFRYAADRVRRRGLANVRLLYADAVEFFVHRLRDDCVDVIHLYFSDPWPKKRHHKRRVVQVRTLEHFHRVLRVGGEVRVVTDHDELWSWCEQHASSASALFAREAFEIADSAGEGEVVGSNFERKYRREGRPFHAMTLRRR